MSLTNQVCSVKYKVSEVYIVLYILYNYSSTVIHLYLFTVAISEATCFGYNYCVLITRQIMLRYTRTLLIGSNVSTLHRLRYSNNYLCIHYVGFIYFSIICLYTYFWLLYTLHLFLRIASPLRITKLEQTKYAKTVHTIEITFVVLLAIVPYIAIALQHKFHIATFPPLYCAAGPRENFYGAIVPTVLASCASLVMMVIILYKIHIVSC